MHVTGTAKRIVTMANFPILLVLVAGLSACRGGGDEQKSEVRPVRAISIEARDSQGGITLTGRVQAQTEVNQSFRLDGQLIERLVDIGDSVKAGQLIGRLDSQNELGGLQSAQAQLVAAQLAVRLCVDDPV